MRDLLICRRDVLIQFGTAGPIGKTLARRQREGSLSIIDPAAHGLLDRTRIEVFAALTTLLGESPGAILCIPSHPADLLVAQAAGAISGAPFGLWMLDDLGFAAPTDVPYLPGSFAAAAAVFAATSALRSTLQHQMQRRIYITPSALPPGAPDVDLSDLLFKTVRAGGRLSDERLEAFMAQRDGPPSYYFDLPLPAINHPIYHQMFRFCDRLRQIGWCPDFVIDVGASTGIWSGLISDAFPTATFVLCDPMFSRYPTVWLKPGMIQMEVAVSDRPGKARFQVSSDLYGSSLILLADSTATVEVEVVTLDQIIEIHNLTGRALVKVDVQFAEHLVLGGALRALASQIDVIILELTLERVTPEARTLLEVAQQMDEFGFRILDVIGEWRDTRTGEAIQFDVAFVRRGMPGIVAGCESDHVVRAVAAKPVSTEGASTVGHLSTWRTLSA